MAPVDEIGRLEGKCSLNHTVVPRGPGGADFRNPEGADFRDVSRMRSRPKRSMFR